MSYHGKVRQEPELVDLPDLLEQLDEGVDVVVARDVANEDFGATRRLTSGPAFQWSPEKGNEAICLKDGQPLQSSTDRFINQFHQPLAQDP